MTREESMARHPAGKRRSEGLGAVIGRAYLPPRGMATVYASDSPTHVTVIPDRFPDRRLWMPRERVQFRKPIDTDRKVPA
ncbi:hypothetical protein [Agromyces larvae]|uniref:Uncharacterized protein n=1 Tax=Agromyces larvae TaxID=2929802 RepID=A0ABY4C3F8_9MICO|nr:hypothetical protein [Agromyces larvae]UOE45930.1 hypothetical protein MTO99_09375 [Agromyces larvae]